MGYLHIDNLYKNKDILLFKECYALEKIHGTSAHIAWKEGSVRIFSGGEKYESFVKIFDVQKLTEKFQSLGHEEVTIFGEAYGGRCQGMKETYGPELKFVAFDVKVGDRWLSVRMADEFVQGFGLEFVHYVRVTTDLALLDAERDKPSTQAVRNGILEPKRSEGVVLRPVIELQKNNDGRIISKHKGEAFSERKTVPKVDVGRLEILSKAEEIAIEWVTPMRLTHVLDKLLPIEEERTVDKIPLVITAMVEDVYREAKGEIVESPEVRKSIGTHTAKLYKKSVTERFLKAQN